MEQGLSVICSISYGDTVRTLFIALDAHLTNISAGGRGSIFAIWCLCNACYSIYAGSWVNRLM